MGAGAPSETTQRVIQELPEEARAFLFGEDGILQRAQALSMDPLAAPEYQVAGRTPLQQAATQQALQGVGSYLPALTQAYGTTQQGVGAMMAGMGLNQQALEGTSAGLARAQGLGEGALQGYDMNPFLAQQEGRIQDLLGTARQAGAQARGATGQFETVPYEQRIQDVLGQARLATDDARAMGISATAGFDPSSYQSFMDPYTEDVIRRSEEDIARQGEIQARQIGAQAAGAGAFGGSRQAVAERELGRAVQDQQSRTAAGLRSQGFGDSMTRAMQSFEQQQGRTLNAAGLSGQLGTTLAGLGLQGTGQAGNMAQQAFEQARQREMQGAGLAGQLGLAAGQTAVQGSAQAQGMAQQAFEQQQQRQAGIAGLSGQLAEIYGRTGMQGAQTAAGIGQGLGQMGQQMGLQDVNTMLTLGGQEQAQQQAVLDAQRQTESERMMMPYQQLGFFSDIFQGSPTGASSFTQTQQPGPSPISQIAGLGLGLGALQRA